MCSVTSGKADQFLAECVVGWARICILNWDVENNVEIFDDEHMEYYKKVEMYKDTELKNLLLNTNRCGLAELQERYVDCYEVMSKISDRDGGEFYVYW